MMQELTKDEVLARWPNPPDYPEILRLWRKYSRHEKEPLHSVFVRIGQQLEKAKPPRCKSCLYTDIVYSRLTDFKCTDPFHIEKSIAEPHLSPASDGRAEIERGETVDRQQRGGFDAL